MRIEEKALTHWIDNFYGYGSWQAKFWFISREEGGGERPEEVAEKLNYFLTRHPPDPKGVLCDIRELYKHVSFRSEGPKADRFNSHYEYRFGNNAVQNSVWKNLVAFLHGYKNENVPDPLAYQKQSFALPAAHTEALIRLYPLPGSQSHAWYYNWLELPTIDFLKSRALYQEYVYERRVNTILSNIRTYQPELVLMYGMDNINMLKKSVQEFFGSAKFQTIKATKQQIPQHHRVELNKTTLLITTQIPALRHNRIETGFDWEEFGKRVP